MSTPRDERPTHELRVQQSGVTGHNADTDDLVADLDIYEALINPHDASGAKSNRGGMGAPMMMAPGMGGGGGAAGPAAAAGGRLGGAPGGVPAGTAAAGVGLAGGPGAGGLSGGGAGLAGGAGAGGGGLGGVPGAGLHGSGLPGGAGGLGGFPLSGTRAAGVTPPSTDLSGPDLDADRFSPGGSSWNPSSTTPATSSFARPTDTTPRPPLDAWSPERGTSPSTLSGRPSVPSSWTSPDLTPPKDLGRHTASPLPTPGAPSSFATVPSHHTPDLGAAAPGLGSPSASSLGSPSAPGLGSPGGPGAGVLGGIDGVGGSGGGSRAPGQGDPSQQPVEVTPEGLHEEAKHWAETAKTFGSGVTDKVAALHPSSSDFGMMKDAFPPYGSLLERLKTLTRAGGKEFQAISDALQAASGNYQDAEDQNTADAKRIPTTGGGSGRPAAMQ